MFNYNEYLKNLSKSRRVSICNLLGNKCSICETEEKLLIVSKNFLNKNTLKGKLYGKWSKILEEIPKHRLLCYSCKVKETKKFSRENTAHGTYTKYEKDKCRCELCVTYYKNKSKVRDLRKPLNVSPKSYVKKVELKTNIHGYEYFVDFEHPLANSSGRVLFHRHLKSVELNTWISKDYHVHHKNGIKNDNRIENLELLTPVEHSKVHNEVSYVRRDVKCKFCSKSFTQKWKDNELCSIECLSLLNRRCSRPDKETLEILVKEMPFVKIGNIYNVSDNAVRKWCKSYSIETKVYGRGYWAKVYAGLV